MELSELQKKTIAAGNISNLLMVDPKNGRVHVEVQIQSSFMLDIIDAALEILGLEEDKDFECIAQQDAPLIHFIFSKEGIDKLKEEGVSNQAFDALVGKKHAKRSKERAS